MGLMNGKYSSIRCTEIATRIDPTRSYGTTFNHVLRLMTTQQLSIRLQMQGTTPRMTMVMLG